MHLMRDSESFTESVWRQVVRVEIYLFGLEWTVRALLSYELSEKIATAVDGRFCDGRFAPALLHGASMECPWSGVALQSVAVLPA